MAYNLLPESTETCLVVQFSGKVTGTEYQQFLKAVDDRLSTGSGLNLVVEIKGEMSGDIDAIKQDFKFAFHQYKQIYRPALVGDQKWIAWFTGTIGPFTRAEEKHFRAGQAQEAIDWACS